MSRENMIKNIGNNIIRIFLISLNHNGKKSEKVNKFI